jgi:hypothetical protein
MHPGSGRAAPFCATYVQSFRVSQTATGCSAQPPEDLHVLGVVSRSVRYAQPQSAQHQSAVYSARPPSSPIHVVALAVPPVPPGLRAEAQQVDGRRDEDGDGIADRVCERDAEIAFPCPVERGGDLSPHRRIGQLLLGTPTAGRYRRGIFFARCIGETNGEPIGDGPPLLR